MTAVLMVRLHLPFKAADRQKRQAVPRPLPIGGLPNTAQTADSEAAPLGMSAFPANDEDTTTPIQRSMSN